MFDDGTGIDDQGVIFLLWLMVAVLGFDVAVVVDAHSRWSGGSSISRRTNGHGAG